MTTLALRLPKSITRTRVPMSTGTGSLLTVKRASLRKGVIAGTEVPKFTGALSLARDGLYWMHPHTCKDTLSIPRQTQFLLWKRSDRTFGVLIPLIDGDLRATVAGTDTGISFTVDGALPGALPKSATIGFTALGSDPYKLVHAAMAVVSDTLRTVRLREQKPAPRFSEYLGWCTWDAFYHDVSESKVMAGLRTFKKGGVQPGVVILDDGWEQYSGDFLDSFEPDPKKFPRGLAPVIARAKKEFGVKLFGIHHPFQGYWGGINPKGELASRYRLIRNMGNIRPWVSKKKQTLTLVDPRDIHRFYDDFYSYLRSLGADMTKVDGQSALELFTDGKCGRVSTMKAYQGALQGAAGNHFLGEVIPCMSNGSDVALHLQGANGWRNSQDYFPKRDNDTQKIHILYNALNAVWTSTFAQPDWDMFQSHQEHAPYHAAARAISGGPIYVCDKPGKQNFEILRKLCTSDGRVLRCDSPALPSKSCLFADLRKSRRLLKLVNRNGDIGVVGLFHCSQNEEPIEDSLRVRDVPGLAGREYAAWCHEQQSLWVLGKADRMAVSLGDMGHEIVTLSPIVGGVAPLGLLDKYNGSRAVVRIDGRTPGITECVLRDGGDIGFYCCSRPRRVSVDGTPVRFAYKRASGLLRITAPTGRPCTVQIET